MGLPNRDVAWQTSWRSRRGLSRLVRALERRVISAACVPGGPASPLRPTATSEDHMTRENLYSGPWEEAEGEDAGSRRRVFWRPDDARIGSTLYELAPGQPESRMHMHFGAEEMFFVLS